MEKYRPVKNVPGPKFSVLFAHLCPPIAAPNSSSEADKQVPERQPEYLLPRLTLSVRWKEAFKEQVRAGKMAVMRIRNLRSQMLALPSVSTHLTVELDDLGCLFQPK